MKYIALILAFGASINISIAATIKVDQGSAWTELARREFYVVDQGSRLINYSWLKALNLPDGRPFLGDGLARYGYIPNSASPNKLPIGFYVSSGGTMGITCSACHTRQINVDGKAYRIDGGPALADFQSFLADLDQSVGLVLSNEVILKETASRQKGSSVTPQELLSFKNDVTAWYQPFHAQMARSLPASPWGPGRLDAVSMIFNRLSGIDISPTNGGVIEENMVAADAPTRYPFLWNASKQDKTQWPGFALNGDDLFALLRNQGEVIGVFARFHPQKKQGSVTVDYASGNSTSFQGLNKAEELIKKLSPPKWPWAVDANLAAQGKQIYDKNCGASCHEIKAGAFRLLNPLGPSWATPVVNVGTDTREYDVLSRQVSTGVLAGEEIPFLYKLGSRDTAFNVLQQAVYGSLMSSDKWLQGIGSGLSVASKVVSLFTGSSGNNVISITPNSYEARVLQGIWATAPYLHNGSVPTLAELLKPSKDRVASFKIGPNYDISNIGIAAEQTNAGSSVVTTDCSSLNSGNSRCGHEYGTELTDSEKQALLEYLKVL